MRAWNLLAVVAVLAALTLSACSSKPELLPSSGPRSAISPDLVKIYPKQPGRYEPMGLITLAITPEIRWDEKADANKAFDALKAKAAAIGANGVLLKVPADKQEYLVTAGYHGTFYQVPARSAPKVLVVEAIYVPEEK